MLSRSKIRIIGCCLFQVLTRAHESECAKSGGDKKPIWQVAEEREEIKRKNRPNEPFEDWPTLESPTVLRALKALGALYRRHCKEEAAQTILNCVSGRLAD